MTRHQHPIGSGFGPASTTADVIAGIDLSGRTSIVTGGYSGLGLETVKALAGAGATVIVPARDLERARSATQGIAGTEIEVLDLMNPASIDGFAARFLASGRPLDLLVNSAGIMATPLMRDTAGNEAQFATNHLGHFRLALWLWPALVKARAARIISVSSGGHRIAPVDFDDVNFERRPYDKWVAYGQSKTANVLFALGLDDRGKTHGIRAFALHPGTIIGPLARHLSPEEIDGFNVYDADGGLIIDPDRDLKTPQQGAATAIWCATSPRLAGLGGLYCENSDVSPVWNGDSAVRSGVAPWAIDPEAVDRLWNLSEKLTGITMP